MINKNLILYFFAQALFFVSFSLAAPWGLPQDITDQNMKIVFEVHSPWNILDGTAEQVSGKVSLANNEIPSSLLADVSVQNIDYSAGLSVAGRLVAVWLRENPPTPAKFVIANSKLDCTPETLSAQTPCKGSVDGELTIWAKSYKIDVPIEMKQDEKGFLLEGVKEIKWGDYGFGDPNSTLANIQPVIDLNFSITLPQLQ